MAVAWAKVGNWEIGYRAARGGAVVRVALLRGGAPAGFVLAAVPGCAELYREGLSRAEALEALSLLARNEGLLLEDAADEAPADRLGTTGIGPSEDPEAYLEDWQMICAEIDWGTPVGEGLR